jgi:FixJ family two-component response regulator
MIPRPARERYAGSISSRLAPLRSSKVFHNQQVAIIDDDESVRIGLGALVRSLGWQARLFDSAEAFLAADDGCAAGCVISDVQMPGMSGIELQELLAARGGSPAFIIMTAFPQEALRKRAERAGAVCFLTKPFDSGAMIGCLEAALSQAKENP